MSLSLYISMLISFATALALIPNAIGYFRNAGLMDKDVHKKNTPKLPHSLGLPVVGGIITGTLFYVFVQVFVYNSGASTLPLFASLTTLLIITIIGFLDDINVKPTKIRNFHEGKRGLKKWVKPLLTLPAALPLMAIMAGTTSLVVPFIGEVQFGILYPLLLVPLGIVGASNMVNMLGGFNGLEVGMGIVYTLSLGIFALMNGNTIAAVLFLITFTSLLAAAKFNFYPAKILPGDSLTYLLGAVIATGAILGNIERAAIIVSIPFIINGLLKFYSRLRFGFFPSNLGVLQKNGKIKSKYKIRMYSLTELIFSFGELTERQMVAILILIQIVFAALPFLNII